MAGGAVLAVASSLLSVKIEKITQSSRRWRPADARRKQVINSFQLSLSFCGGGWSKNVIWGGCRIERRGRLEEDSGFAVAACVSSSSSSSSPFSSPPPRPKTKLFVSGLSFRTTEESLRNAFQDFGQLVEVNLVMDRIANRPRGFAFIRYVTEEESQRAIEGMHGKFLDGRVIFVEIAKPRSELRSLQRNQRQF